MAWKNIKSVLNSRQDQRMVNKVFFIIIGVTVFGLAAGYFSLLQIGQKSFDAVLKDINFLYFLLMVYTGFLLFNLVYKKRILRIFKITSFLIFCAGLVVFGFKAGSFILQTSGLLIFLALAAQFIYSIFHSAKDVLTEKDEIKLKEEFNQK